MVPSCWICQDISSWAFYIKLKVDILSIENKNEFIAKASAKNLAAMFTCDETYPSVETAVQTAIDLWDELVKQGIASENN